MASLVLFCDGTWNRADQVTKDGKPCVTNVLKLAVRTKKKTENGKQQIVYYDQGVGTGNLADRLIGGLLGEGLVANVIDSYRFLIANYVPGDDIYLFGFSRGAYTARCIAGLVSRCGILRRDQVRRYNDALRIFHTTRAGTDPEAVKFRAESAIEEVTPIRCIGVWDTVGALGIPLRGFPNKAKYEFLDTRLSRSAQFAFHALAVDEHRDPFMPTLWDWKDVAPLPSQTIEQVWFAGAHSDVGGGYPEVGLSDIAMNWMMRSAEKAGLEFDSHVVTAFEAPEDLKQNVHPSRTIGYKLTSPHLDRAIGDTSFKTEYFHRSLLQRWQQLGDKYRPKSLVAHRARIESLLASPLTNEIYPVTP